MRNEIPGHLLKQLHLSLCAKGGKAGCDVGRAKEGENVISEGSACRVRVKLRRASTAHRYRPLFPGKEATAADLPGRRVGRSRAGDH